LAVGLAPPQTPLTELTTLNLSAELNFRAFGALNLTFTPGYFEFPWNAG
jgi:hypothetical protein